MEAPIKLTNLQLVKLANALAALDGVRISPTQFEPFQFNPEHSWKVASNIGLVADKVAAFERAKKHLMIQYQMGDQIQVNAENVGRVQEFIAAIEGLETKEIDVTGIELLSREKLSVGNDKKKNQNQIAPTVLAALAPILEP